MLGGSSAGAVEQTIEMPHPQTIEVNTVLEKIADVLDTSLQVKEVKKYLVPGATVGAVQWLWVHYRPDIDDHKYPLVDRVNKELLFTMQPIAALPEAGLDALIVEGLIKGHVAEQIAEFQKTHRALIQEQFTRIDQYNLFEKIPPRDETVDREMHVLKNLLMPMHQIVYDDFAEEHRTILVSPLGRLGAGYILSTTQCVDLQPAEDPYIYHMSGIAEKYGNSAFKRYWIIEKRNEHFVKCILESGRQMNHITTGDLHSLRDEVKKNNQKQERKISQLVVQVNGLQRPIPLQRR